MNSTEIKKGAARTAAALNQRYGATENENPAATLQNALTDLRHIADQQNLDFAAIDKRAYRTYSEEAAHLRAFPNEQELP